MTVTVALAGETDVEDARRVMRRVLAEDLGGYRPQWHADVDDPAAAYLRAAGAALFVARLADVPAETGGPPARPAVARLANVPAGIGRSPDRDAGMRRSAGPIVGTAAVRPCRLQSPPNPAWLARRYSRPAVCELRRVWVVADARRRGVGAALVGAAARWATTAGYRTVYLHTDAGVPGAAEFWRAMPTTQVHDARPDPWNCVHFVLDPATPPHTGTAAEDRR